MATSKSSAKGEEQVQMYGKSSSDPLAGRACTQWGHEVMWIASNQAEDLLLFASFLKTIATSSQYLKKTNEVGSFWLSY